MLRIVVVRDHCGYGPHMGGQLQFFQDLGCLVTTEFGSIVGVLPEDGRHVVKEKIRIGGCNSSMALTCNAHIRLTATDMHRPLIRHGLDERLDEPFVHDFGGLERSHRSLGGPQYFIFARPGHSCW